MTQTNLHPVDELFQLRADKAAIEQRIDELRHLIMEMPPVERVGSMAAARVVTQQRRSLDMKAITGEMGQKWVDERSTTKTMSVVRLEELQ